jgi:hypothetical protein
MWIGALCINQLDDEEKALHVQRMSVIFAFTTNVLIWLGPIYEMCQPE